MGGPDSGPRPLLASFPEERLGIVAREVALPRRRRYNPGAADHEPKREQLSTRPRARRKGTDFDVGEYLTV